MLSLTSNIKDQIFIIKTFYHVFSTFSDNFFRYTMDILAVFTESPATAGQMPDG